MLEKELKQYEHIKAKLREENPQGGFVVIKDEEILGVWNDRQDAIRAGLEKYGNVTFLVKNIQDSDKTVNTFSRNIIFT
jgi:hypothetical protein